MKRRGVSGVVTSVLLVLLAVAAGGIMWAAIRGPLAESGKSITSQTDELILNITNTMPLSGPGNPIICYEHSDCGHQVASGDFCIEKNVYYNTTSGSCQNPGTTESQCIYETQNTVLKAQCSNECSNGECVGENPIENNTYYASNNGAGNGQSSLTPFMISDFWELAQPGYTLILLDGEYKGKNNMIHPPASLSGNSVNRITIKAQNDGQVYINGEGVRAPVIFEGSSEIPPSNNYFTLEGFNAYNSNSNVIKITGTNNILKRVVAWDASITGNSKVIGVHYASDILIEDSAGFGTGRKIMDNSAGGNNITWRRNWGRWDGSIVDGNKQVFTQYYNNFNNIFENNIGTFAGMKMPENYSVMNHNTQLPISFSDGTPWEATNYAVVSPIGVFGYDHSPPGQKDVNLKVYGNIAYSQNGDRVAPGSLFSIGLANQIDYKDNVAYIGGENIQSSIREFSGCQGVSSLSCWNEVTHQNRKPFSFFQYLIETGDNPVVSLNARNLTGIRSSDFFVGNSIIGTQWNVQNHIIGTAEEIYGSGESIFNSNGKGAEVCYKYVNGILTNEPLWPWPMEERIYYATQNTTGEPVNVTQTMINLFGQIPSNCLKN